MTEVDVGKVELEEIPKDSDMPLSPSTKSVRILEEEPAPIKLWPRPLNYFGQLWAFVILTFTLKYKGWQNMLLIFVVTFLLLISLSFTQWVANNAIKTPHIINQHPDAAPPFMKYDENVDSNSPPVWFYLGPSAVDFGTTAIKLLTTPLFSLLSPAAYNGYQVPYPEQPKLYQASSPGEIDSVLYDVYSEGPGNDIYGSLDIDVWSQTSLKYKVYYNYTFSNAAQAQQMVRTLGKNVNMGGFINSLHQAWYSQLVLERTALQYKNATFQTYAKNWPSQFDSAAYPIIVFIGPFFLMFVLTLILPVFTSELVAFKERRLLEMMEINGGFLSAFWLINFVAYYLIYLVIVAICIIYGLLFQWQVFTQNPVYVYLPIFITWGFFVVSLSLLLASVFSKERSASSFSYILVFSTCLIAYVTESITGMYPPQKWILWVLGLIPPVNIVRGMTLLFQESTNGLRGITFEEAYTNFHSDSFLYLNASILMNTAIVLALFLIIQIFPFIVSLIKTLLPREKELVKLPPSYAKSNPDAQESARRTLEENVGESQLRVNFLSHRYSTSIFPELWRERARERLNLDDQRKKWWKRIVAYFLPHDVHAVTDLALTVKKGTCVGLLGPNGAGKTTTMEALAGVLVASRGTAEVAGEDMFRKRRATQLNIGLCPQYDHLFGDLTASEVLHLFGRLRGLHLSALRSQVTRALEQVNLTFAANKRCGMYSGGMRRRLSIAVALVADPAVLLLDEPTTGLDPGSRLDVWECLNNVIGGSTAVLLTTHSMEEADYLCNYVNVIDHGLLVAAGKQRELKTNHANFFKLRVSAPSEDMPMLEEELRKMAPSCQLFECLNHVRIYRINEGDCDIGQVYDLLDGEKGKDELHVYDWALMPSSLEDVFGEVTDEGKGGQTSS